MTSLLFSSFVRHPAFQLGHFSACLPPLSSHPLLVAFSCAFWCVVLFSYVTQSSFHLFSVSVSPRAIANNGVLKSILSCHFSDLEWEQETAFSSWDPSLILNLRVREGFTNRLSCPLSYFSIRTFQSSSLTFDDYHKSGLLFELKAHLVFFKSLDFKITVSDCGLFRSLALFSSMIY